MFTDVPTARGSAGQGWALRARPDACVQVGKRPERGDSIEDQVLSCLPSLCYGPKSQVTASDFASRNFYHLQPGM